jgi:hypothetical protein
MLKKINNFNNEKSCVLHNRIRIIVESKKFLKKLKKQEQILKFTEKNYKHFFRGLKYKF